jgi:ketosteroid isomerase-like protein
MSENTHFQWTRAAAEAAEAARCAALIAADGAALRALFAPDATWLHGSGQMDAADVFIDRVVRGINRYLTIDLSEVDVRLYGDTAIVSGVAMVSALAGGEPRALRNRYTNVWVAQGGRPRLVSAQSTKLA